LNSLLFLVLFCWIIFKIKETKFISQLALFLVIFVLLRHYDTFISSPNTDLLPNILVVYLLLRAFLAPGSLRTAPLLYLLLPVFCLTLKLSQVPICLLYLAALVVLIKSKQYKLIFSSFFLCCALFVPWCIRNVIISGYLIYPFPSIDLFVFDWKIPISLVEREKMWIFSFARMPELPVNEEVLSIPFLTWGKIWLINCFKTNKTIFFILCLVGISPLVILYHLKRQWKKNRVLIYLWLIAFSGTLFWAIMGPDVRFGLGFIIVTALAPFLMFYNDGIKASLKVISPALLLFSLLFFINISLKIINKVKGETTYQSLLYKPQSFTPLTNEYTLHKLGNVTIYVPVDGDQCGDQKLPCSPAYCYSDSIELRGKLIKDGFRVRKNDKILNK
jgi:hypothetical protein